ncbi:MAG: GNAT family N-acetyltransferase [Saprospiraceae bacterium]|nr:GNAT family N-acetyltransferase [Saprospiraceae bacterium]
MENIILKKVELNELELLQDISRLTFTQTFAEVNSPENLQNFLDKAFSVPQLSEELQDPNVEYYFSEIEQNVIGYLKINFGTSQTELQDDNAIEIERIYVLEEYLGKKVGQKLYDFAIKRARETSKEYVWLGVWEENSRAINFYKKQGFQVFGKHFFILGDDFQTDILMKKIINLP